MDCPKCRTALAADDYEGVEIDRCPDCQGIYLDEGELKKINDRREATFTPEEIEAVKGVHQQLQADPQEAGGSIGCPKCGSTPMRRLNYASQSGVVIDKCDGCQGIWLDRGEVEKIQILVEGWESEHAADLCTYSEKVAAVQAGVDEKLEAGNPYRGRLMRTLFSGFFSRFYD